MTKQTARDVFLYYPNIIGYTRVLCTLASLLLMMVDGPKYWLLAIGLYLANFVGDLFGKWTSKVLRVPTVLCCQILTRKNQPFQDGMVARKYNQTSTFGGLLDMVTDRCSTLGLLFVLGTDYSKKYDTPGYPVYQAVSGILLRQITWNAKQQLTHQKDFSVSCHS